MPVLVADSIHTTCSVLLGLDNHAISAIPHLDSLGRLQHFPWRAMIARLDGGWLMADAL